MRRFLILVALLALPGSLWAETKTYPATGKFVGIVESTEAGKWWALSQDFLPVTVKVYEGGKVCMIEGAAGRYAIVRHPPGDEQPEIHIVTLGGAGPTPIPVPTPTPTPTPVPIPVPVPSEKLGFTTIARDQAAKLPTTERMKSPAVADNFEGVGGQLAAGGFPGSDSILRAQMALVEKNRATIGGLGTPGREAWYPFFVAWQVKADALNKSGAMTKAEDYVQAYKETAAGLRMAAQGVNRVSP